MFDLIRNISKSHLTPNEIAKLLKTTPEALKAFEEAYRIKALEVPVSEHDPFAISAIQAKEMSQYPKGISSQLDIICKNIVCELLSKTKVYIFDGKNGKKIETLSNVEKSVTKEELSLFPIEIRPMCTGELTMVDMNANTGIELLEIYARFLKEKKPAKKKILYKHFRQGLDILDLDALTYAMIGTNPNSMGHWLPAIVEVAIKQDFLKIPKTTIIQVPLTLLQLTRLDYSSINATTRKIINDYCMQAFSLDVNKDYFIKTGTYSSKFDFRNAHVTAGKEVTELGEYLLFIQNQACNLAGPLTNPSIYGMSTTYEWIVRDFITDIEQNPCIYKGMPLHTEYRIFVDFNTGKVIGANPYWDSNTMKKRFASGLKGGSIHDAHDYAIYCIHEETLMKRYNENIERVINASSKLAANICNNGSLAGQWSIDIMQNGEDFWLIDMAIAENSAFYECVPKKLRCPSPENWLPLI